MYYSPHATAMNQRFKLILIATALIHGAVIFYKLGGDKLIFSTGEMTESLSVKVLLQQALRKPSPAIAKPVKKPLKKKKTLTNKKTAKPISEPEETEVAEQTPSQTPAQAFDSLILDFIQPSYPRVALRRGITGVVILNLFINNDGSMEKILVSQSSGNDLLDNSALRAAKQWKFKALGAKSQGITVVEKRIVYKIN